MAIKEKLTEKEIKALMTPFDALNLGALDAFNSATFSRTGKHITKDDAISFLNGIYDNKTPQHMKQLVGDVWEKVLENRAKKQKQFTP